MTYQVHLFRSRSLRGFSAGFSVLELLVAFGVFLVLSGSLMANYRTLDSRFALDTEAQLTASAIREAQVSAMSVRMDSVGSFNRFGIHFDQNTPNSFVFFADRLSSNMMYDPGTGPCGAMTTECEKVFQLPKNHKVVLICVEGGVGGPGGCSTGQEEFDYVDIVFTRPNPDADISGIAHFGPPTRQTNLTRARITLENNRGYRRVVEVWQTGQISVQ